MRSTILILSIVAVCALAKPAYEWRLMHQTDKHPTITRPGEQSQTYISQALPLLPGGVINSDPAKTPLTFPTGDIALTFFDADIVRLPAGMDEKDATIDDYVTVPLDEVYLHHWLVENGRPNYSPCSGLQYLFGVGAESRNTKTAAPEPYGWVQQKTDKYSANIHILNTQGVADVKACIECYCPYGGGFINCCPDGFQCKTNSTVTTPTNYYLRYMVNWVPNKDIIPLYVTVIDTSPCLIETNIPSCNDLSSGCHYTQGYYLLSPWQVDVVFAVGHQHVGGEGITLQAYDPTVGQVKDVCHSDVRYGASQSKPGDELGYVVEMGTCTFTKPQRYNKGTYFVTSSTYSSNPWHGGTMGLFYVAFATNDTSAMVQFDRDQDAQLPQPVLDILGPSMMLF